MGEATMRDFEELSRAQRELKEHLLYILEDKDRAHREVTAEKFRAIDEATRVAHSAAQEAAKIAREAVQTALNVLDSRLAMTNEWRAEYTERARNDLAPIKEELATLRGKASQSSLDRTTIISLAGIALGIIAVIKSFLG